MKCDDVFSVLGAGSVCEETPSGVRVSTHCLYPSFDPVEVFVARYGEGYIVSDGGGAAASAWDHGRAGMERCIAKASHRFGVESRAGVIEARIDSVDWLKSAILAVANASAFAAEAALERSVAVTEHEIADRIFVALARITPKESIARDFEHRGSSGKRWRYDFGATVSGNLLLVNAVAPHHASISAKYVAFADTPDAETEVKKFAVYGRRLETADASLITQVANLVPVSAVEKGVRKVLVH